ncbi:MAG TPA: phenylalanine--tRNA ligase subunit beta [Polyangia bacterium]
MKVSLNWVKELLSPGASVDALDAAAAATALTMAGLEVESVTERGKDLSGVVVAEVLGIRPHPSADKLRLVRVRAGDRTEEVVCGAPNVPPPGHHVVWAPPGARLPGGRSLEAREVRGVMSPGMLCSEPELGLGEKGEGILLLGESAQSGADFVAAYAVADDILEVNVTPNRADALSHIGIARELAAALGTTLAPVPSVAARVDAQVRPRDVVIDGDAGCPRYRASFVSGVTVGESPLGMKLRLAACGVRPISNLVDVTNYVLLELGHPLHAFDLDAVQGPIRVRSAKPDERLVTLDGIERSLVAGDIVIADDAGALALAGVMGGARSEVKASTRTLLLEAATFDPSRIRRTSKRLGLSSEASYRFERGVDAEGLPAAGKRATELLASLGNGAVGGEVVDRYPQPVARRKVSLPLSRLARVAGQAVPADEAVKHLRKISDDVTLSGSGGEQAVTVAVPTYRPDLGLPEDLVEEVLRLSGRYQAPAQIERVLSNASPSRSPEAPADRLRNVLAGAGLSEIAGWGFIPRPSLLALTAHRPDADPSLTDGVLVKNPISADYEVMRTSLLPGLAAAVSRNLSRGVEDVRLFEVGPVVRKTGGTSSTTDSENGAPTQREVAGVLLAGRSAGWLRPGDPLDFFDLKRVVEVVLAAFGIAAGFEAGEGAVYLHPGVAARILTPQGRVLGHAGELDPRVARRLGIEVRALYAELEVGLLDEAQAAVRGVAPPRFPGATRDLSFWIDASVPAAAQSNAMRAAGEPLLVDLAVREDFRDPRYVAAGKKGMLWSMVYRADDRTLTDAETDAAHARVVSALTGALPIQIR